MPNVKTAESVQLELEISRNQETKNYIQTITESFENSKKQGVTLNPQAIFNTYISAIAKCAVLLIRNNILRQDQVNSEFVSKIALELTKNVIK